MRDSDRSVRSPVDRRRFITTAGAAGVTLLAGCGGGDDGGAEETTEAAADAEPADQTDTEAAGGQTDTASGGTFTLEYVDVDGDRTAEHFQPVIDELNSEYDTQISLNFREIPYDNMKQQLLTRVGAGDEPDVAAIDQIWLGEFYQSGKLMTFNDVQDQVNFDDYFAGFQDAIVQDDDFVAFPITTDVRGMYWHKSAFEDAGLDPDSPPETWSAFYEAATQLHNPPGTYGTGLIVAAGIYSVPLFGAGGQFLSDDGSAPAFQEEPGVQAATVIDDIHNNEEIGPPEPVTGGSGFPQEFLNGQYATTPVYGSWMDFFGRNEGFSNEELLNQFGFGLTPHLEGSEPATMNGGFGWAAFGTTEQPEIVKDFMIRVSDKEFNRKIARETGRIPTRQSLLDADEVWENILWEEEIKGMLEYGSTRPVNNWSVVSEELTPALQAVAFDRQEPQEALQQAADAVSSQL